MRSAYYSTLQCTLPDPWSDLKTYLAVNGLEEIETPGNGLCLLNSICEAVYMDYNMPMTVGRLKTKIIDHLRLFGEQYLPWFNGGKQHLITEAHRFLENGQYNTSVGDLMLSIIANVLMLNIRIFQRQPTTGYIHIMQHIFQGTDKLINLKFHYNPDYSEQNHYDSICRLQSEPYFEVHSETQRPIDLSQYQKRPTPPTAIDLTQDTTEIGEKNNQQPIDLTWSPPPPSPPTLSPSPSTLTISSSPNSHTVPIDDDSNPEADNFGPTPQEVQKYLKKMHQGVSFPFHLLEHIPQTEIPLLPDDIDGWKKNKNVGSLRESVSKRKN